MPVCSGLDTTDYPLPRVGRRMNQLPGPGYYDITDVRNHICILQKFRGFLILTSDPHLRTQGDIGAPDNKGPRFGTTKRCINYKVSACDGPGGFHLKMFRPLAHRCTKNSANLKRSTRYRHYFQTPIPHLHAPLSSNLVLSVLSTSQRLPTHHPSLL